MKTKLVHKFEIVESEEDSITLDHMVLNKEVTITVCLKSTMPKVKEKTVKSNYANEVIILNTA